MSPLMVTSLYSPRVPTRVQSPPTGLIQRHLG
jgi:hypothetical protein